MGVVAIGPCPLRSRVVKGLRTLRCDSSLRSLRSLGESFIDQMESKKNDPEPRCQGLPRHPALMRRVNSLRSSPERYRIS
jgi:hypothetical protein